MKKEDKKLKESKRKNFLRNKEMKLKEGGKKKKRFKERRILKRKRDKITWLS
jgi:hypothetical protein